MIRCCGEIILPKEYRDTFESRFPRESGDAVISIRERSGEAHITFLFASHAPSVAQAEYLHTLRAYIHKMSGKRVHCWWSFASEPALMQEKEATYALA